MNLKDAKNDLNDAGFKEHAKIENEHSTEYRFNNGADVIRLFEDKASGICTLEM